MGAGIRFCSVEVYYRCWCHDCYFFLRDSDMMQYVFVEDSERREVYCVGGFS